jgi:hypothetical protein
VAEIGLADLRRTRRLIELARRASGQPVRYVGIDAFETRVAAMGPMRLKDVHCAVRSLCASCRLLPGTPSQVLPQFANALGAFDLVILGSCWTEADMQAAWFYLPRMLGQRGRLVRETHGDNGATWPSISADEIQRRIAASTQRAA